MKLRKISAVFLIVAMLMTVIPTVFASAEYGEAGAVKFVFSDTDITVSENSNDGYKIDGTTLELNAAGTYIVSGECRDGKIEVKKNTQGVTLVLDGLTLESDDTAPIVCGKTTEVAIVAAAGSVNNLKDSEYNNDDDDKYPENKNAEKAVIKCKDDSKVTICGSGELNVYSYGKNGIKSGAASSDENEAFLTVKDLTLYVSTAVNDAITAEQELNVLSGNITIDSADDGVKSDRVLNIGAEGTEGPTINVRQSYEGIEAATINVYSGNITVYSEDDCMNAANSDLDGTGYVYSLNIYGGNIYMTNKTGDGIDSNGTVNISGGKTVVWTPSTADNQPLDADGLITITGGVIFVAGGSSGMPIRVTATQGYVIFGNSTMGGGFRPGQPGGGSRPGQPGNGNQPSINIPAGSTVTVKDESGNELISEIAYCRTLYVFFSCPAVNAGDTYTVYSDDTSAGTATAQGGSAAVQPGESENPPVPPTGDPFEPPTTGEPPIPPTGDPFEPPTTGEPPVPPTGDPFEPPTSDMPPEPPMSGDPVNPPVTDEPTDAVYTVTFQDKDGNEILKETAAKGTELVLPDAPEYDYWVFYGWDKDVSEVTEDMTVKAVYYMLGDTNMNGEIDSGDATIILRCSVGSYEPNEFTEKLCDVNKNEQTDAGDATVVLRHIVGTTLIPY